MSMEEPILAMRRSAAKFRRDLCAVRAQLLDEPSGRIRYCDVRSCYSDCAGQFILKIKHRRANGCEARYQ